jgi:hypothetical protein
MANSEDYSFEGEQEGSKRQAKPIGKRGYYKTPVQETVLPTTEMTKKLEAQIARNSREKGLNNNVRVPLESGDKTSSTLKEHAKTAQAQGALITMRQPDDYQTFPVKVKAAYDTAKSTTGAKTVIEKQPQFELHPRQDKAAEPLLSVPSVARQVGQEEGSGLDKKNGGQRELPVYGVGASKQNASRETIDLLPSGDYLYPLTVSMALWQDFALSAIRMYNECAKELSEINNNWMDIFLSVWRESNTDKKNS